MSINLAALPDLDDAIATLEQLAAARGILFRVANEGGYRTEADTARILAYREAEYAIYAARERTAGRSPLAINKWRPIAPFGSSYHNYGAARDLEITARPSTLTADDALEVLGSLAPGAGLRWGGSFGDPPHFELPISLDAAAAAWAEYSAGGDVVDQTAVSSSTSTAAAFAVVAIAGIAIAIARSRSRRAA